MVFLNGLQCRNSDFKRFIPDDLATSYKKLVNVGPLTPESKRGEFIHPSSSSISSLAKFVWSATATPFWDQYLFLWGDQ